MSELLTPRELAKMLRIAERTVERWRESQVQSGPPFVQVGGVVRYRRSDVEQWLKEGEQPMVLNQNTFRSEMLRMRHLDHAAVPFLNDGQWIAFRDNPWRFYCYADEELQEQIWLAMVVDRDHQRRTRPMLRYPVKEVSE